MTSLKLVPLLAACALSIAAPVAAQPTCRPTLTVKEEGFSKPFNLRRAWTASLEIDASRCSTTSGLFSIGFVRLAENAPDLSFAEPFLWQLGQKKIVVEFWADEAVHKYWIADIAACPCRD